jgi:hypothetical protein
VQENRIGQKIAEICLSGSKYVLKQDILVSACNANGQIQRGEFLHELLSTVDLPSCRTLKFDGNVELFTQSISQ